MTSKRSAAQYAALSRLIDQALELDAAARTQWLAKLPEDPLSAALTRMFAFDRALANRTIKRVESRLGSCARGVRALRDFPPAG
jgi:hypothetical protein